MRYRLHALQKMAERGVSPEEVRTALAHGEVIEHRRREGRYLPTRLLLSWVGSEPLHVLVADDPGGTHYVITAYHFGPDRWTSDYRTRRRHS